MDMDRETLRHLLLEYLKKDDRSQLTTIYNGVAETAFKEGYIEPPSGHTASQGYSEEMLPQDSRMQLQELTWELIIQGILTPGANSANPNLPFVRLTEYGRKCVDENDVLPHDYGTYLQQIKSFSSKTDAIFLLYLTESVQAFIKGLYNSSILNLGIASEQLTLLLITAYKNALATKSAKQKFDEAINKARHIAYQFDELYKRLEVVKGKMPIELGQDIAMIRFLENIVRQNRNDAGHPSGRSFEREEALALLVTFPHHYKTVVKLLKWLSSATI